MPNHTLAVRFRSAFARRARLGALVATLAAATALVAVQEPPAPVPGDDARAAEAPATLPGAYVETIPGTGHSLRMVPIPPRGGEPGYWIGATEVTWDVFDLFVFGEDSPVAGERSTDRDPGGAAVDAFTRPSKPYVPPDRGFGHEGYPVISASAANAREFCRWLSATTGRAYRLPTVAEWRHAAAAGSTGRWASGDDPAALAECAWSAENAEGSTHPVGAKRPNAWGLHDAHGNAGEWCLETDDSGKRRWVLCGGTFLDDPDGLALDTVRRPDRSWQMSDPQLPKSRWWLSDAPFAGLRILRPFPATGEEPPADGDRADGSSPGSTRGTTGDAGASQGNP